jgi:hypothetical protein
MGDMRERVAFLTALDKHKEDNMAEPVIWLEVLKVGATVLASAVAGWVAYNIGSAQKDIASRQASTAEAVKNINQAKLNLDLFEERYKLFEEVWGFLSRPFDYSSRAVGNPTFTNLIPRARFLFGKEIGDYMTEAHSKQIELATLLLMSDKKTLNNEQSKKLQDLEHWFHSEATACYIRFGDYLDFSHWKVNILDRFFNPDAA